MKQSSATIHHQAAEKQYLHQLYWWSFSLRFGAGSFAWILHQVIGMQLIEDSMEYERHGAELAQAWLTGQSTPYFDDMLSAKGGVWVNIAIIAAGYLLMGGARLLPALIAMYCFLTAWTPVFTYRIARQLGAAQRGARVAAWLVALSPAFAFWAGALYKEGVILLVLNLALYHTLLLQEGWRARGHSLWIVCLCVVALYGLRFYLAIIMCGVLGMGLLLGRQQKGSKEDPAWVTARQTMIVAILAAGLVALGLLRKAESILPTDVDEGLSKIENSRLDLARSSGSGYLAEVQINSLQDAIRFLPIGMTYFLSVPFPWQWGSMRQNLVIPETLAWVALYPMILAGMREGWRRHAQGTVLLLIASFAFCAFYALFIGNIGTAYRMRIQVWVLWAVFAGLGWERWFPAEVSEGPLRRQRSVRMIPALDVGPVFNRPDTTPG